MMKYILIPFLFLAGFSPVLGQSVVKEYYFHDLKGMEDSTGVTHLFYRILKDSEYLCDEGGYDRYLKNERNDIYHFDTSVKSDSLLFRDHFQEWCIEGGMSEGYRISTYAFLNNDINTWVRGETWPSEPSSALSSYDSFENDNYISLGFDEPQRIFQTGNSDSILVGFPSHINKTVVIPSNSEKWPDPLDISSELPESLRFINQNVVAMSPYSDSVYFSVGYPFQSSYLYKSINYGKSYAPVDTLITWDSNVQLFFDKDSTHIYAVTSTEIALSQKLGEPGSWEVIDIQGSSNGEKILSVSKTNSGNLFVSDSTSILFSENYGESFSELLSVEHKITGLYKKPNSELLYVLTTNELLEVNTKTKARTSLKQLPVSNEPKPS